ncbi:MAG: PRC-barrel domain containing protein [Dehalococcoidia bacterium]|nr:MAG: PRC-barrel domain containing protein [Dehalococcoidia bacterium]
MDVTLTMHEFRGYRIDARDGHLGHVVDVFFDDETWVIRYIVVETGAWLHRRRVLVSPIVVRPVDGARTITVDLTCDELAHAPAVDTDMPISRQMELKYRDYFAWPRYWLSGFYEPYEIQAYQRSFEAEKAIQAGTARRREPPMRHGPRRDPHLRSAEAITGYRVTSGASVCGHATDFVLTVDGNGWRLRDFVIEAGGLFRHRQALLAPAWIEDVSWATATVRLSLPCDAVFVEPAEPQLAATDRHTG